MKVKIIQATVVAGKQVSKGTQMEVSNKDGRTLLAAGRAKRLGSGEETMSIHDAIQSLNPANPEHFTKDGKPKTDALEDLLGREVSAAERDEAWEEYEVKE